ncbi:MAG TPA: hypothetical protein VND65_17205 [Candidatus Binatia bacterium]|nr:hypothetical protein [Candidatus Binatia bacterium]
MIFTIQAVRLMCNEKVQFRAEGFTGGMVEVLRESRGGEARISRKLHRSPISTPAQGFRCASAFRQTDR